MSGFVAATSDHVQPDLPARLVEMSQEIKHRGEHRDTRAFSSRCAAVARFRDKSGYRVNTYSNDRFAIVLDGLIFNRQELVQATGCESTANIAQIVLDGFEQQGDRWFERLDGSFAIMIVDLRSHEVVLARDRFGHRPLYFGTADQNIWVASEIKAIRAAPGFQNSINEDNVASSIAYGLTPGPQTLLKGIYKCVPGFVFRIADDGNYRAADYLTLTIDPDPKLGLGEAKEFILSALRERVDDYISVCPDQGLLLSGGVDSSLLAYLAAAKGGKSCVAISLGATDWSDDESDQASQMAGQLGLEFMRTNTSPNDDLLGSLRRVIQQLEDPTRFENALPFEIGSRLASGRCTALMTGEGADMILGSLNHVQAKQLSRILRVPGFLRAAVRKLPLEYFPARKVRALEFYLRWKSIWHFELGATANCIDLVSGGNAERPPHIEFMDMLPELRSDWPLGGQYTNLTTRIFGHCWPERMEKISAAAGLECFHPFECNSLFQFGLDLPDQLRSANGILKPAVRSLVADLFGNEVAYRDKKQLAAPMQLWLNRSDQLRTAVLDLKHPDSRIRAYLDNTAVNNYLQKYETEGAQDKSTAVPIFRMLAFEIWLEMFT